MHHNYLYVFSLKVFLSFFAIMNPFDSTLIFLVLTSEETKDIRKKIALNSILVAFFTVVFFAIVGDTIFKLFGISLPAFRITGGLIIFIIGFQMLHGEESLVHIPKTVQEEGRFESKLDIAISPLGIPILAGPGTISTAINYSTGGNFLNVAITIIMFGILCWITYIFFIFGEKLIEFLGKGAIKVIIRLMGLILAIFGTQMVLEGIGEAIKYLKLFYL